MRDDDHAVIFVFHELFQQINDDLAVLRIEVARRFIREDNFRVGRQRPRDGDALLLTAGEHRRQLSRVNVTETNRA